MIPSLTYKDIAYNAAVNGLERNKEEVLWDIDVSVCGKSHMVGGGISASCSREFDVKMKEADAGAREHVEETEIDLCPHYSDIKGIILQILIQICLL